MAASPRIVLSWLLLLVFSGVGPVRAKEDGSTVISPRGQYRVTAKPTEKRGKDWQMKEAGKYIYTCQDTRNGQILWTRKQKEASGPNEWGEDTPERIYVSDDGWTVIYTGRSELIPVDVRGVDHGKVNVLGSFSKGDREKYVRDVTDMGPLWADCSLWYFVQAGGKPVFVVRPWWGHRVAVDLAAGKVMPIGKAGGRAVAAAEHADVLAALQKGADTFEVWEKDCCPPAVYPVKAAAYVAGTEHQTDAVPLLRRLEACNYSGSSTSGMLDQDELKQHDGGVDPGRYEDYTLRQIVQLSLRRLGQTPRPLPGVQLQRAYVDYKKDKAYPAPLPLVPREDNAAQVKPGQSPEQVLALLGAPDLVEGGWVYDLDGSNPHTLTVIWKGWEVKEVRLEKPAWKDGFAREQRMF